MINQLLQLLEQNARYSDDKLAAMLGVSEKEVHDAICDCEKKGILRGYSAIVDWEKTDREHVSARIELKVTPKKDRGFDELAEQIASYDEVQSLALMSGGYDLALTVIGESFKEIASFVAFRLAPMDSVQSTATHFVLRQYKERGMLVEDKHKDERNVVL